MNKREKGSFAPNYYGKFKCIADKCRHSCCIDWEICIDEATYEKYKQLGDIADSVKECEDGVCFELRADGRCPHLNETGLCNIILTHGGELLSEICRNHPRFFNEVGLGRCEVGLGIVCEEACRLILADDTTFSLSKIPELEGFEPEDSELDFDPLPYRDRIISVIESRERGFDQKLADLKSEFEIPEPYEPDEWLERYLSLEILDEAWKIELERVKGRGIRERETGAEEYEKYYERLLKYFVYRHVSMATGSENLRARLGFALLSVDMIRLMHESGAVKSEGVDTRKIPDRLIDLARRYSAEIEYSQDNTDELIFAFESGIYC